MAQKTIVETVYGKYNKYDIVKVSTLFSIKFQIYRDGKYHRGSYSTLPEAIDAAKRDG